MFGDGVTTGADARFFACLGAAMLGLLASTLWVLTAPPSLSILGLLFILGGIGVCYLGLVTGSDPEGADPGSPL